MFVDACRRGVVVVAHPDDESLWAGGLLIRYARQLSVICCSIPRTDPVRAWKFFDACDVLGVRRARLLPFIEPLPQDPLRQLELLDLSAFDLIVTHNAAGEYGHLHHRTLHRFIVERWGAKTATFGYGGAGSCTLRLTPTEESQKREALQCYDHVSPIDGKPKWQALIDRYSPDFSTETFDPPAG